MIRKGNIILCRTIDQSENTVSFDYSGVDYPFVGNGREKIALCIMMMRISRTDAAHFRFCGGTPFPALLPRLGNDRSREFAQAGGDATEQGNRRESKTRSLAGNALFFFSYPLDIMHSIPKAGTGSWGGMVLPIFE
ncbi:MAG: hypothetical protein ACYDCX_12875 [Acidithiobacillus sp.]